MGPIKVDRIISINSEEQVNNFPSQIIIKVFIIILLISVLQSRKHFK